jgi:hypothetical protein
MIETLNLQEGDFVAFAEQKNGAMTFLPPRRALS